MSNYSDLCDELRNAHPYGLARRAGCVCPDAADSPGGDWLDTVRRVALERADELQGEDDWEGSRLSDVAWEAADSVVPIYTHTRWTVFADLCAWQEDVSELGYDGSSDMTQLAGVALYMIAERLVSSILQELAEAAAEDAAEHEDDTCHCGHPDCGAC